jgi:hypothetical protein
MALFVLQCAHIEIAGEQAQLKVKPMLLPFGARLIQTFARQRTRI